MSKDLVIGTKTYEGVSTVNFNTSDNGIAVFKDVDEISSGGGYDISTELTTWATNDTAEDVKMSTFFADRTLQLPFTKGVVVFHVDSDTAPTQGSVTMQNLFLFVDEVCVTTALTGASSLVAPNSIEKSQGATAPGTGAAVFNATTKIIQFYSTFGVSAVYIPAGAVIKVGFIPFEFSTGLVPTAE